MAIGGFQGTKYPGEFCNDRARLLAALTDAARQYSRAAAKLAKASIRDFDKTKRFAKHAREQVEQARLRLQQHREEHGC